MEQRHRKVTLLVSLILSAIALLAIVAALAADRDRIMRELAECNDKATAQKCECEATVTLPWEEMSVPGQTAMRSDRKEAVGIYEFFRATEYRDVADIITAMSILETGWYRSEFHSDRKNYFSTKRQPNGVDCTGDEKECFTTHKSLEASCQYALKGVFRKRGYRTDRDGFMDDLIRHGYATDPLYVKKVQGVLRTLGKEKNA